MGLKGNKIYVEPNENKKQIKICCILLKQLRGKFLALNIHIRKEEKNNLSFYFKNLEKEQNKPCKQNERNNKEQISVKL